jgi:hypothetical protein
MGAAAGGVLLIDVENVIGKDAKPDTVARRLDALIAHAGPGVLVVAGCARSRITPTGIRIVNDRGARLLLVTGSKGAADEALLAEARRLADEGCRRFVVASGDGTFGQLADLGDLEIMIWKGQAPRKKGYTQRATTVHRLARPTTPTSSLVSAKPKAKPVVQKAPASKTSASPGTSATIPGGLTRPTSRIGPALTIRPGPVASPRGEDRRPVASGPPRERACPAAPGTASLLLAGVIFAAGACFGAGTVVGVTLARRLLRPLTR